MGIGLQTTIKYHKMAKIISSLKHKYTQKNLQLLNFGEMKEEGRKYRSTSTFKPGHCLPVSFFSMGAGRAESDINLNQIMVMC